MLVEIFSWVVAEVLVWIALFILAILFWLVVLPILLIVMTPVFLITSANGEEPYGQALKRKYKRLVDLWTDLTSWFP